MRTYHRVQALAQAQGLCIADLARLAHRPYSTIHSIYHDSAHESSYQTWHALAQILGVSVEQLVEVRWDEPSRRARKRPLENTNAVQDYAVVSK